MTDAKYKSLRNGSYVLAIVLHFTFCRWGWNLAGARLLTLPDSYWPGGAGIFSAAYIERSPLLAALLGIVAPVALIVGVRFLTAGRGR